MRQQAEAGVLLCTCSKNNEDDVRQVFGRRREMPLREEDFAGWKLNWQPKSENLKALARELNLGLEAFVFVDDNPVECAEVEASLSRRANLLLPEDPDQIPHFLQHCWVFDHLKLTAEDRTRGEKYRQKPTTRTVPRTSSEPGGTSSPAWKSRLPSSRSSRTSCHAPRN